MRIVSKAEPLQINYTDELYIEVKACVELATLLECVNEWCHSFFAEYNSRFGFVSLFNGISTFVGYLMPKPFS